MTRPRSINVRLYKPKLTRLWWVRFTAPPHVLRHLRRPPADQTQLIPHDEPFPKPDKDSRVSFSLKTTHQPTAERMRCQLQVMLELAWEKALTYSFYAKLTGENAQVTRTVAEFFDKVRNDCAARVAIWNECSNPVEAKRRQGLHPHTAHDYELCRQYFLDFLAAEYPSQIVNVHDVGLDVDNLVHLAKFKKWFYQVRGLGSESWSKTRGHLSWAWQQLAMPDKLTQVNPWPRHELAPKDEGEKRYPIATADQRRAIMDLPNDRDGSALKVLLWTGRRVAELSWLQRSHLDFTKTGDEIATYTISKKGRTLTLPVPPAAVRIIRNQIESHNSLWVFPREDGTQAKPHYLQTQLGRVMRRCLVDARCPLPTISPQSLRRTFASLGAHVVKVGPHDIRDLMSHTGVEQQKTYIQPNVESLRAAAAAIEREIVNG